MSPNSQIMAAAGVDNQVRLWQLGDAKPTATLAHPEAVTSIGFDKDSQRLVTACTDKLVRVYHLPTGVLQQQFAEHAGPVNAALFSADGTWIATAGADNQGRIVKPAVLRAAKVHEGPIHDMQLSPDGNQIYTTGADKVVAQWNTSNLAVIRKYEGATVACTALARSGNNQFLAAGGADKKLHLWNTNGQPLVSTDLPEAIGDLALNTDAKSIVVASPGNVVRNYGYALVQGKHEVKLSYDWGGQGAAVTAVALTPDGKKLYAVAAEPVVRQFAVAATGARFNLTGHGSHLYDLAFSPDGKRLATASADKTIKLWNLADGKNYATCSGHTAEVYGVRFHPSKDELVSCSADKTIRVWNGATGRQTKEIKQQINDALYSIDYAPDGKRILSPAWPKRGRSGTTAPIRQP